MLVKRFFELWNVSHANQHSDLSGASPLRKMFATAN